MNKELPKASTPAAQDNAKDDPAVQSPIDNGQSAISLVAETEKTDKIVRLLCNIQDRSSIVAACLNKLGIAPEHVDAAIAAAKDKLTRAADYHRDHELGRAITRLNELFSCARGASDTKNAIAAQKELNRLLSLYPSPYAGDDPDAEASIANRQSKIENPTGRPREQAAVDLFDAIDAYLEPLNLSDDDSDQYPDIIRLAGAEIKRLRKGRTKKKRRCDTEQQRSQRNDEPESAAGKQ